jgi:hypothetical protein
MIPKTVIGIIATIAIIAIIAIMVITRKPLVGKESLGTVTLIDTDTGEVLDGRTVRCNVDDGDVVEFEVLFDFTDVNAKFDLAKGKVLDEYVYFDELRPIINATQLEGEKFVGIDNDT